MDKLKSIAGTAPVLASVILVSAGTLCITPAYSSGFQISETSASGLGRAFAGAGVAGDDGSDQFYNPAGIFVVEKSQFQIGLSGIETESDFQGSGQPFGGPGDDGGGSAVVPNIHYSQGSGGLRFGLSITSPFGLATEYDDNWAGRYQGLKSELRTIDINPSIGYEINDNVTVGFGISAQYADAELSQARFLGQGVPDGTSTVEGDNWAAGFNLGAMFRAGASTRLGIGYRSKIDQDLEGDLTVVSPAGTVLASGGAEASVSLPETVYLSAVHSPSSSLDLLASARWTKWSRFDELRIGFDNGLPDAVTEENWEDSWTLSIGANYHVSDQLTLRFGYAHDESPVSDEFRTVRIPDSDRNWFTIGASWAASDTTTIDFGYAHLEGDDASINETVAIAGPPASPVVVTSNLSGDYDGGADIVGIQFQFRF